MGKCAVDQSVNIYDICSLEKCLGHPSKQRKQGEPVRISDERSYLDRLPRTSAYKWMLVWAVSPVIVSQRLDREVITRVQWSRSTVVAGVNMWPINKYSRSA